MPKETELKFLVSSLAPVRKKLKAVGGVCEWKGEEENWFFDTKDNLLRKRDAALRIKNMGDTRLTLKEGMHVERGVKIAEEHQIKIEDAKTLKEIFKRIGLRESLYYKKKREHWRVRGSHVELDTLPSGRMYVEVESSHAGIKGLAAVLGLDFSKTTTKSYTELV